MTSDKKYTFRFLDLCAGIGGFHQAMTSLGGECIGASEIDASCIDTYVQNFPSTKMFGNINSIDPEELPDFEVLCAGFPCQPFSKAGKQLGFRDESRGKLFYKILDILDVHKEVEFLLLENVRNLADRKDYWNEIQSQLSQHDFVVSTEPIILSPSDFGIPQIRERVFILGIRKDLKNNNALPNSFITEEDLELKKQACTATAALDILDADAEDSYIISPDKEEVLFAWDEFRTNTNIRTIGFPVWISCFGLGIDSDSEHFEKIGLSSMPKWKQNYVKHNRHLYQLHRDYIDDWVIRYHMSDRTKLLQKFEWNCGEDIKSIKDGLIQIRQSGVRVKRPNCFPALVAIANTPIVWDECKGHFREITPKEAAKLQSFEDNFVFKGTNNQIYKQLGNAVNVEIAKQLTQGLMNLRKQDV